MTTDSTQRVVLAMARAKPGREAELAAALEEVAQPTRAQAGCLSFALYRSAQDPAAITALERWVSDEHHQAHMKGEHVSRRLARFDGVVAEAPQLVVLRPM